MNDISEKVINFICYGGLGKDEFETLQPVFDKMNLKIWRILSIVLTVVYGGLFFVTLKSDSLHPLWGVMLTMFLLSGFMIVLFFKLLNEDSYVLKFSIYCTAIVFLVFGMHVSMFIFTDSQSVLYFFILLCFNVIMADSSYRVGILDLCMMLLFVLTAGEYKAEGLLRSVDIMNGFILTFFSMIFNIAIMYIRTQGYHNLKIKDKEHRQASDEVHEKLKKSMHEIEVLSALSADFENIIYFDINTNTIQKFFSNMLLTDYEGDLTKLSYGEYINLFTEKIVCDEDRNYVKEQLYPKGLQQALNESPSLLIRYKAVIKGELRYYESKIIRDVSSNSKFMFIAATHDIDAETRRYNEYTKTLHETEVLATSDMLTGVKNKTAYLRAEKDYNRQIDGGESVKFAIVMCDVNNLKVTNDQLGHEAGDKLIKTACRKICSAFEHSPVYRIGGDEFVIIATGRDYLYRIENFEKLRDMAANPSDGITFASGMACYDYMKDKVFNDVFARADADMYENKKIMKEKRKGMPKLTFTTDDGTVIEIDVDKKDDRL